MKKIVQCKDCRFFVVDQRISKGECHRFPPIVVPDICGNGDIETKHYNYWPDVRPSDFCGEWKAIEENAEMKAIVR
jgi:hypothetical protein